MFDVVVVGAGPAGLSAALVLARARLHVLVCDAGHSRNAPAGEMHGFLSRDGSPPLDLLALAREQLLVYPSVEIVSSAVREISKNDVFSVDLGDRREYARRVILATGMMEELPTFPGPLASDPASPNRRSEDLVSFARTLSMESSNHDLWIRSVGIAVNSTLCAEDVRMVLGVCSSVKGPEEPAPESMLCFETEQRD